MLGDAAESHAKVTQSDAAEQAAPASAFDQTEPRPDGFACPKRAARTTFDMNGISRQTKTVPHMPARDPEVASRTEGTKYQRHSELQLTDRAEPTGPGFR
jgi:hypothetical protein